MGLVHPSAPAFPLRLASGARPQPTFHKRCKLGCLQGSRLMASCSPHVSLRAIVHQTVGRRLADANSEGKTWKLVCVASSCSSHRRLVATPVWCAISSLFLCAVTAALRGRRRQKAGPQSGFFETAAGQTRTHARCHGGLLLLVDRGKVQESIHQGRCTMVLRRIAGLGGTASPRTTERLRFSWESWGVCSVLAGCRITANFCLRLCPSRVPHDLASLAKAMLPGPAHAVG